MPVCTKCKKVFPSQRSLISHMQTHRGNRKRKCPKCGRWFMSPQGLGAHLKAAHGVAGQSETARKHHEKRKPGLRRKKRVKVEKSSPLSWPTDPQTGKDVDLSDLYPDRSATTPESADAKIAKQVNEVLVNAIVLLVEGYRL